MHVAQVLAVCASPVHGFSKQPLEVIELISGLGVAGDAHAGATVQHRSRVRVDPSQPNLRQVHLLQSELFGELRHAGFELRPGDLGENITTRGIDLLALPRHTVLRIGAQAVLELTGLRNPCHQIEAFRAGLLSAVLPRDAQGQPVRKAGVMAVVLQGGAVRPLDPVRVELPAGPHQRLERV